MRSRPSCESTPGEKANTLCSASHIFKLLPLLPEASCFPSGDQLILRMELPNGTPLGVIRTCSSLPHDSIPARCHDRSTTLGERDIPCSGYLVHPS